MKVETPSPSAPLRVTARQFTIARGKRWEKSAGFLHWTAEKFGDGNRKTISEWAELWSEFWTLPVNR